MASENQVRMRLLVDNENNRVLSAEAGKDFVDALFSFLTMPLGTIARIVNTDSILKPVRVGSLSSLYQSVANLDEKHFWTETCKKMLLRPRNSMESHQNPKLNIDDSEPVKYFVCGICSIRETGGLLSTFKNKRCRCGKLMNLEVSLNDGLSIRGTKSTREGYVNETAAFTISDDLKVMPSNLQSSVALMKNLGIENMKSVEEITVNVDRTEVVDLLKFSLLSKTPLTDLFFRNREIQEDFESDSVFPFDFEIGKVSSKLALAQTEGNKRMKVKVMLQKSENKVLFVQAEEDFADFLLSLLTLPLGGVLNLFQGNSGSLNLDNLFKSLVDLHASKHLKSEVIKNMLVKPRIAQQFKLQNLILPIDEAPASIYTYSRTKGFVTRTGEYSLGHYGAGTIPLTLLDPKSSSVDSSSPTGFAKGPSMYMVTDDLVVTSISSISVASFLNKSKIPLDDLEERVISVGLEEGLSILKASLISSSALTMGLSPFIEKERKREEWRRKDKIDCIFSLLWEFILKRKIKVL